jgi:hypothetical protein
MSRDSDCLVQILVHCDVASVARIRAHAQNASTFVMPMVFPSTNAALNIDPLYPNGPLVST